jgi:hypothetical protein
MKFVFRSVVPSCAFLPQKHPIAFRSVAVHAASVVDATERFMRDQLLRKREKTLSRANDGRGSRNSLANAELAKD